MFCSGCEFADASCISMHDKLSSYGRDGRDVWRRKGCFRDGQGGRYGMIGGFMSLMIWLVDFKSYFVLEHCFGVMVAYIVIKKNWCMHEGSQVMSGITRLWSKEWEPNQITRLLPFYNRA